MMYTLVCHWLWHVLMHWASIDRLMGDGWITWRRTDRQIEIYTYIWLDVYLHVMCHLKDVVTYWVPPLNEYLDISTFKYALWFALATVDYQPMMSMFASNRREHPSLIAFHLSPELFCDMMKTVANGYVAKRLISTKPLVMVGFHSIMVENVKITSMESNTQW